MTDYTVYLLMENFTALASKVSVMVDGKMEYSFDEADGLREDSFYYYYISVSSGIGVLETEPRECCEYNWARRVSPTLVMGFAIYWNFYVLLISWNYEGK